MILWKKNIKFVSKKLSKRWVISFGTGGTWRLSWNFDEVNVPLEKHYKFWEIIKTLIKIRFLFQSLQMQCYSKCRTGKTLNLLKNFGIYFFNQDQFMFSLINLFRNCHSFEIFDFQIIFIFLMKLQYVFESFTEFEFIMSNLQNHSKTR